MREMEYSKRYILFQGSFINILNKNQQTLKKICKDLNTKQIITTETTKQSTIIDHIHTNITTIQASGVIKTYYSDHDQIFIQLQSL